MKRALLFVCLAWAVTATAQVPSYVPTDGLVAWYPMNGNALDESGNGYDCQSIGATLTEDRFGAPSSAYAFDGQGSHLQGSSLPFSDLTISLWFKAEAGVFETYSGGTPPTGAQLIGQGTTHSPCRYCDWAIGISDWPDGVDKLAWEKANSSSCQVQQTVTTWEPELAEWTHLVALSEGADVSFYINGDWVSTIAFDQPFQQGGSILSIGSRYVENCNGGGSCTGPDNAWSGSIDDVAVWNRMLSTEEINALYGASSTEDDGSCLLFDDVTWEIEHFTDSVHLVAEHSSWADLDLPSGLHIFGSHGDHLYLYTDEVDSWSNNRNLCESASSQLTSIQNESENQFITSILEQHAVTPGGGHLGASDAGSEGNWQWIDGTPWNYENWASVEPSNSWGGEHYGQIYSSGLWNDCRDNTGPDAHIAVCKKTTSHRLSWDQSGSSSSLGLGAPLPQTVELILETDLGSCSQSVSIQVSNPTLGCTDAMACNYNADASENDGSCTYPPSFDLGEDVTLCAGESATLTLDLPGQEMLWSTGSTETEIAVTESGTYSVEAGTTVSPEATAVEFGPNQLGIMGPAAPELDLAGTSEVTLATWVKLNSNNHQFRLVSTQSAGSNHQQYALMVSSGRLYFISGSSSFEANGLNLGNATLPTDTWIHAAVTVSPDGVRFYLDGELDLFNPVNDVLPSGYSDMVVLARRADGGGGGSVPEQLDGSLSQVSIWNRALSAEEMAALPDCPPFTDSEGLVGLWLADQTPTTVVTDETGNGSDIDLTSGTVVSGPEQSCSSCTATDQVTVSFDPCYGCTNSSACNFDSNANLDDGSCIPSGCMEEGACNYNADAQCEGEACDYSCCPGPGCCGNGMHWDAAAQTCVITPPSVAPDAECTLLNLQELAEGYQILLAQNAELDSLLADCNGTSTSDQSGPCSGEDVVTYHGYDYDIIEIGDQCWFAENARYLPEVSPSAEGSEDDGQPHAYVYDYQGNNITEAIATSSYEVFGALYNFPAVAQWTLCPTGWHVGTDENWKELESHLGMSAIELDWYFPNEGYERGQTEEVGSKLKALTWDGTNPAEFNAINTGWRWTGIFSFPNTAAFWTSTEIDDEVSWARTLETGESGIVRQPYYPHFAKSVRCVKD